MIWFFPQSIIDDARGEAVALLNRNKPTAYIIPAKAFEMLLEMVEEKEVTVYGICVGRRDPIYKILEKRKSRQ